MLPLLQHELKFYFKNKQQAIYLYSYFISIILMIPFSMSGAAEASQGLAGVSLWIALASAAALGGGALFSRDHEQGRLKYYQLLPMPLEGAVFAKWLAFYLFLLLPMLAAIPLAALLFGLPLAAMLHYAIGLMAGAAGLSLLSATVAALTVGLEKAGAVLSLIMLPLSVPILIFGTAYCRDVSHIFQPNLLFLCGFSLFLLPVLCLAGAYSIRHSN